VTNLLEHLIATQETILLDGAIGTYLMARGLTQGAPPEIWNRDRADVIRQMHRDYIEAGSQLILTNSFGGSSFRLKLHDLHRDVYELNRLAAAHARAEADAVEQTVVVGGSIGPSGELLVPMGEMTFELAVAEFAEQARGLADGGVDVFWIETMSDLQEVEAAVLGCRQVSDLPVCATLSFDTAGHTMMGVSPQKALTTMREWDLLALGANCGAGVDEMEAVIATMHECDPTVTLIAKANAGIPEWADGALQYNGTPEVMGMYAHRIRKLGARLIGGCCGNTPFHMEMIGLALQQPLLKEDVVAQGFSYGENAGTNDTVKETRRRKRKRA
jgi:5-methyltetrahydrofolate--homocysteine methyltransferase